jgi:alpha-tubulin suppressor-like RCC1 family protein
VWTWGNNEKGKLGNGYAENTYFPAYQVPELNKIISVAGGFNHSIALEENGTMWTWGANGKGQLGDGTDVDKLAPVKVLMQRK